MAIAPFFFAYNPRLLRAGLLAGAVCCVALAAWALANALRSGILLEWARLGVAAGLLGAFVYVLWRTRPRDNWGVKVDRLGLTISRPLSGAPIELVWSQIHEVRRQQQGSQKLLIMLRPEGRLLVPRHLFPSGAVFDALVRAVEERLPPPTHQA